MAFQFCKQILSSVASRLHPYIPVPLLRVLSPNPLRQPERTRRFVCGILTSTALAKNYRQVTDFVALRAVLGCPDENSFWLCGEDIRSGLEFVLGGPAYDRLVFEPPPFEEVFDTSRPMAKLKLSKFWTVYTSRVQTLVPQLTPDDTLFLVICGHGSRQGSLVVGNERTYIEAWPSFLEAAVKGCKVNVQLITTACHSALWASPEWDLFAAAAEDHESVSIVVSESGHCLHSCLTG